MGDQVGHAELASAELATECVWRPYILHGSAQYWGSLGGGGGWDDVDIDVAVAVGGGVLGPVVGWAVVVSGGGGGVCGELGLDGGIATVVTHIFCVCVCVCVFWSMGGRLVS